MQTKSEFEIEKHEHDFRKTFGNPNLQNLFICITIKVDKSWIMDDINKLDNFDGLVVGGIDVGAKLYEEALAMVKKFDVNVQAMNVLLDNIQYWLSCWVYSLSGRGWGVESSW